MIIIADDYAYLTKQLQSMLARLYREHGEMIADSRIVICHDVATAIDRFNRSRTDLTLLVLDLCFGADANAGFAVLEAIARHELVTRVVIFTAYDFPAARRRAKELGVDASRFVGKAEPLDRLKVVIALALWGGENV